MNYLELDDYKLLLLVVILVPSKRQSIVECITKEWSDYLYYLATGLQQNHIAMDKY